MSHDEEEAVRAGHGKWSKAGVPHKGWFFIAQEDLGEPSETCEMCEKVVIRYVYVMGHADYPDELRCGCVCAGHMEQDLAGARKRDEDFKKFVERRTRFPGAKRWKKSRKGNPYINKDGDNITIYPNKWGRFGFRIKRVTATGWDENDEVAEVTWSPETYATETEAKMAVFDHLEGRSPVPKRAKRPLSTALTTKIGSPRQTADPWLPTGNEEGGQMTEIDLSDDALALEFAKRATREGILYNTRQGWLVWDQMALNRDAMSHGGPRVYGWWRPDDTMKVMRLIRDVCREVARQAEPKAQLRLMSWSKMTTVERMARSDQRLAAEDMNEKARKRQRTMPVNLRSVS